MTTETTSRVDRLCAALALDRRGVLPREIDSLLADRLLDAAILGADDATMRQVAGDAMYRDGYAVRPLATFHWHGLRVLAREAQIQIAKCGRDIETLHQQRDAIERLLLPSTIERTTEP